VSHLVPEGVTHLQYADDTILLIELDDGAIANLKFIVICFEILSGLKINFFKSEVIVTGVSPHEQSRVARMFYCKNHIVATIYISIYRQTCRSRGVVSIEEPQTWVHRCVHLCALLSASSLSGSSGVHRPLTQAISWHLT
jgi:hypothetical protein